MCRLRVLWITETEGLAEALYRAVRIQSSRGQEVGARLASLTNGGVATTTGHTAAGGVGRFLGLRLGGGHSRHIFLHDCGCFDILATPHLCTVAV